ncbi:MAG: terminase family protein [Armatimonadetes bacterium]|nr:terminase family protein [Armatimonadota bacterium]
MKLQVASQWSPYCPFDPYPKQQLLIDHPGRFILAHGTTRSSKSVAALMKVVSNVHVPQYSALFLRRTFPELEQNDGPLDMAKKWFKGTDVVYDSRAHRFTWPSGASLEFGHCDSADAYYKYLGGRWTTIIFDELTSFTEQQFGEICTRNTKSLDNPVPLQVIGTTNPGGPFEAWVFDRFINPETKRPDHCEINFDLSDNPSQSADEIRQSVGAASQTRQRQLLQGEWMVAADGQYVSAEWFQFTSNPPEFSRVFRSWDISLTKDGNWTVGTLIGKGSDETYYILDVIRVRLETPSVRQLILDTAAKDPPGTIVCVEKTVVSLNLVQDLIRNDRFIACRDLDPTKTQDILLPELKAEPGKPRSVHLIPVKIHGRSGDKLSRASGFISRLYEGKVFLKTAPWNTDFIAEFCRFTNSDTDTDDQIDSCSLGFEVALRTRGGEPWKPRVYTPGTDEYYDQLAKKQRRRRAA